MIDAINGMKERLERNSIEIKSLEMESTDINHAIGMKDYDEEQCLSLYNELRNALRKRWELKQENELLAITCRLFDEQNKFVNMLLIVKQKIENQLEKQRSRDYVPRIRFELFDPELEGKDKLEILKEVVEKANAE